MKPRLGKLVRFVIVKTRVQKSLIVTHTTVVEIEFDNKRVEAVFHGIIFGEYAEKQITFRILPAIDIKEKKPVITDLRDALTGDKCCFESFWN